MTGRCCPSPRQSHLPDEGPPDGLVIPGELGLHVLVALKAGDKRVEISIQEEEEKEFDLNTRGSYLFF